MLVMRIWQHDGETTSTMKFEDTVRAGSGRG